MKRRERFSRKVAHLLLPDAFDQAIWRYFVIYNLVSLVVAWVILGYPVAWAISVLLIAVASRLLLWLEARHYIGPW